MIGVENPLRTGSGRKKRKLPEQQDVWMEVYRYEF